MISPFFIWMTGVTISIRPRSGVNQLLKHAVIFRPAVRITGTIFRNRSDVDCARSNHFRPAYCHGKKVSIAKRNVGHWNRAALRPGRAQLIFRHGNLFVCQRRPANRAKMIELHHKALTRAVEVRNLFEGPALASLRPLPVACVKQRDVSRAMPFARYRRADAGIHSPAQQHHRFS